VTDIVYDSAVDEIRYTKGKRVTTWTLDNEDLLDTLADILEVAGYYEKEAKPASYIEPPIPVTSVPSYDVDKMKKALGLPETPKADGVSWDDEAGVDSLPIM
jgi:hypothetical protein